MDAFGSQFHGHTERQTGSGSESEWVKGEGRRGGGGRRLKHCAKVRRKGLHATDPQPCEDQDRETKTRV